MRKLSLIGILILFSLILFNSLALAVPEKVAISLSAGIGDTSNVNLSWKFTTGDSLYKSTDGNSWTQVSLTGTNGQDVNVLAASNVPNYSLIYFEVRSIDGEKRINVFPPTPNAHANYEDNTDTCKGCHSTHTATQKTLLLQTTVENLCNSCHGAATTKSRYSVVDGTVLQKNGTKAKSLGGAFTGGASTPWGSNASSTHSVNASNQVAPGGVAGSNTYQLTCTDCHTGHTNTNNYRLTKSLDVAKTEIVAFAVNSNGNGDSNPQGYGENYNYKTGLNEYCSACHTDYQRLGENIKNGDGSITKGAGSSADAQGLYRHPTKVDLTYTLSTTGDNQNLTTTLPLGNNGSKNLLICATCHFAHGTNVAGDNPSKYDRNGDTIVNSSDVSTMMKRLPYMGVCQECHKK